MKKKKNAFFNENIQQIVNDLSIPEANSKIIQELVEFELSLDEKMNDFEKIFMKASNKLKAVMWYNPHIQCFLMETKPGIWIHFQEMFPGDISVWNYLLRTKQLFNNQSQSILFEELQILKPSIHRVKDSLYVNINQSKDIIANNNDIFSELENIPFVAITNEQAKSILHKISLSMNAKNLVYVRNMIGMLLGYPRQQVLLHNIVDNIDYNIFVPKFNDFTENGFFQQTYPLLTSSGDQNQLIDLFAYLEEAQNAMNNLSTSFTGQEEIHMNIKAALIDSTSFLRSLIFEHYFPESISQNACDTLDEYILYSFPHHAFPTSMPFHQYGLNWLDYEPHLNSSLMKGKILLTLKKVIEWKTEMRETYQNDIETIC